MVQGCHQGLRPLPFEIKGQLHCELPLFCGLRMKLRWRRLEEGEQDLELVLGMCVGTLYLAGLLILRWVPGRFVPPCFLHQHTGIPCPTCGTYRAVSALLSGRAREALTVQPLMTMVLLLAAVYVAYAWVVVCGKRPRLRLEEVTSREAWVLTGAMVMLVALNWLYLLSHSV